MGRISEEQMTYTSKLAALKLSEGELDTVREGIEGLFECFDVLATLDTEGVEPAVYVPSCGNVFREDECKEEFNRDGMLQNAPLVKDGAFVALDRKK